MAFTTKDFPNRVFQNIKEYEDYIKLRKKVKQSLFNKKSVRKVKVNYILHKKDLEKLREWISK